MKPNLEIGDVVIVCEVKAEEIKLDDIIAYQVEKRIIIHRVVEIGQDNGEYYFITKGDNNADKDDPVEEYQLVGKVILRIPYLGYPTLWLSAINNHE